jgi:hypothetical protein
MPNIARAAFGSVFDQAAPPKHDDVEVHAVKYFQARQTRPGAVSDGWFRAYEQQRRINGNQNSTVVDFVSHDRFSISL